ncbi:iron-sulfur cluster carrier protein ApbC [Colwellia sp. RSH04]|nr:iron-sulfur cluster carrier protein ApbC [Colwellia sp. RSH04]
MDNQQSALSDKNDDISVLKNTLSQYRSQIFPQGVLDKESNLTVKQHSSDMLQVNLFVPFPCQGELNEIATSLSNALSKTVIINGELNIKPVRQFELTGSGNNIKNIIAIASGKGGVGKSTTTVNLAYALMCEGAKVGILDADIYGPSMPTMLGLTDKKPTSTDGKYMTPLNTHGLEAMSIGFLVDKDDATVWRGPMASSAFNQLLNETAWSELDYLLIDMPPGTGDIQLTLAQKVPVAAAVIVTTPQDIALVDAGKGVAMFDKVKVPVLGIVENMSYHTCENCGHKSHIFGHAGGEKMATNFDTPLLGQLPLNINIRHDADSGKSDIIENSTGEIAQQYRKIARNIAGQLYLQCDNNSSQTPNIDISLD